MPRRPASVPGPARDPTTRLRGRTNALRVPLAPPAAVAPEMLRGEPYGPEVDLWSVGVVLFTLLAGHHPFDPESTSDDHRMVSSILRGRWSFDDPCWRHVSPDAKRLVSGLLEPAPEERLTLEQVLASPWVRGAASDAPLPGSDVQLRAFNECRKLWRAAIRAAALIGRTPGVVGGGAARGDAVRVDALAPDAVEELRAAFDAFDADGSGSIDVSAAGVETPAPPHPTPFHPIPPHPTPSHPIPPHTTPSHPIPPHPTSSHRPRAASWARCAR